MPPANTEQDIDKRIAQIQAAIAKKKKKIAKFRGRGTQEFEAEVGSLEDRLLQLRGDRDIAGVEGISNFALSEEQKSGLFGQAQAATEAATRESIGDLSARFGGDTSNPLFNFLQQTTLASGAAAGAGQRLGIEVEEARRAQEIGLQKQQLTLGFGQLGLSRKSQQFQQRLQTEQFRFNVFQGKTGSRAGSSGTRGGGGGGGGGVTFGTGEGGRFGFGVGKIRASGFPRSLFGLAFEANKPARVSKGGGFQSRL